ncbi:MAG TPA: homoserine O-acetyltransferase [Myxococcota bacterium]|nr:homoserine O-acetyltransferase [Myxococcota bacterium]
MKHELRSGPEPHYDKVVSGYETFHSAEPFACEWGGVLPGFSLAYETWGTLSPRRDNAILLHTGLSASSHAKSHPRNPSDGWWERFIGPGAPLDTNRYFVVCSNLLGGCYGSTGPMSTNPATDAPWATDFPILTVTDMVRAQLRLLDHLKIERLHAAIGASLGGMQSLAIAALAPERVGRLASISAALRAYPQSIAMRFVQRQAVMADPDWRGGRYYGTSFPHRGQRIAREIGTITYRSGPEWQERFGRERGDDAPPRLDEDFQVERYLAYQGDKFCLQYDANSYLYISKAMDLFDLLEDEGDGALVEQIRCPALVIGVTTDVLFPVWQQRELAEALTKRRVPVTYVELDAAYGHDAFLIERERVGGALAAHLRA